MKQFFFSLVCLLATAAAANAQYTLTGKIEYEKKMNVHAIYKEYADEDDNNSWYDEWKAKTPKFTITYFDMVFDTARAIYKPGREVETSVKSYNSGPASDNTVLTDFNAKKVKAVKAVYEQKFFVEDSTRKIEWTVKEDLRTIENYKCHKAVGRICDSVYVVAFYTEDIPVSGGPEMFGGLPGMILELAIPRLHTTWVADKIEAATPTDADFKIPEKGKKVNEKELFETIQSSLKDWGKYGKKYIWWTVL